MPHNTRVRVDITDWGTPTKAITPAELDKLDQNAFQSINGDLGGVWAPSVLPITIGGLGLTMEGPFTTSGVLVANGTADFFANVTLHTGASLLVGGSAQLGNDATKTLDVEATATFNGPVTLNNSVGFFDDVRIHSSAFFQVDGNATFGHDPTHTFEVDATATFNGPATLNGSVDFFDDVTVHTSGLFNAGGSATLGNDSSKTLTVGATSTFNGPATLNNTADFFDDITLHTSATLAVNGEADFNGPMALGDTTADTIDVPGTMNLHNCMAFSFNGRVPMRGVLVPDTAKTYSVADGNLFFAKGLSAPRTYSISDVNAKDGDFMLFSTTANAGTVTVETPSGEQFAIQNQNSTHPAWVMVARIGGLWWPVMRYQ